ncbi:MAG: nucleotide excision repair endonuclease [Pirellulaceae bacterium]|nr:nucleotide excision repair endonuclease [Pirellulaceae bacterium]
MRFSPTLVLVLALLTSRLVRPEASQGAETLDAVVIEAFRAVHDGWSADEVLLDDDLNAAFIRHCRERLPDASAVDSNWRLLNLRKAGRLQISATRTKRLSHDAYLHAAEIAARFVYDKHRQSIDRALCDPALRTEFDQSARQIAPEVSAYALRKAAFALRKTRRLRPELVTRVAEWGREINTWTADEILRSPEHLPAVPGVYLLRDQSGYLYIGEASNLRKRILQHLDASDRQALMNYLQAQRVEQLTVEVHAFDPQSAARSIEMRRAYESELIRSRRPRFNIAP